MLATVAENPSFDTKEAIAFSSDEEVGGEIGHLGVGVEGVSAQVGDALGAQHVVVHEEVPAHSGAGMLWIDCRDTQHGRYLTRVRMAWAASPMMAGLRDLRAVRKHTMNHRGALLDNSLAAKKIAHRRSADHGPAS